MNEQLFQFIWQYSLYHPAGLKTTSGEEVVILFPGLQNKDAGPDFQAARIRIGGIQIVGHVELHLHSSDWRKHEHYKDPAYHNLILHVVHTHDDPGLSLSFPTLELRRHIPGHIPARYMRMAHLSSAIPCESHLKNIPDLIWEHWLSRMFAERWEEKRQEWDAEFLKAGGDWRVFLYVRLAAAFGFKINALPFQMLARALPLAVLSRHADNLLQTEALLFGQAGMLDRSFRDIYPLRLQREYLFLRYKYNLPPAIPVYLWKYLRLRPANFPAVRIAQFAGLVHRILQNLSRILSASTTEELLHLLQTEASSYWENHCRFEQLQCHTGVKALGKLSVVHIIIHAVVPFRFLYAQKHDAVDEQPDISAFLAMFPAEQNRITRIWKGLGHMPGHAAESQALLQLYNRYCRSKRCMECAIGLKVLRSGPDK